MIEGKSGFVEGINCVFLRGFEDFLLGFFCLMNGVCLYVGNLIEMSGDGCDQDFVVDGFDQVIVCFGLFFCQNVVVFGQSCEEDEGNVYYIFLFM